MDITELLAFSVEQGASDLHLSAGLPPMIRVDGDVRRLNVDSLDHSGVQALIYDIMNDRQREDYEEFFETDFSFEMSNLARFRVNAFNQHRGAGAVFGLFRQRCYRWTSWVWVKYFATLLRYPEAWFSSRVQLALASQRRLPQ